MRDLVEFQCHLFTGRAKAPSENLDSASRAASYCLDKGPYRFRRLMRTSDSPRLAFLVVAAIIGPGCFSKYAAASGWPVLTLQFKSCSLITGHLRNLRNALDSQQVSGSLLSIFLPGCLDIRLHCEAPALASVTIELTSFSFSTIIF